MEKEYYLGLDMGTNSVGWAVTDDAYNLIRFKGKDMWGIREFDEANPAVERRTHRTSRRREQRNAVRMGLIRSYFADEIQKDADNKDIYVHYHDSICLYGSTNNQLVDVEQAYNEPLDLNKLVTSF